MRRALSFLILFYGFFISVNVSANEKNVRSTVSAVTVYTDQAMITRSITESLPKGEQALVVTGLPSDLSDQSLVVSGESDGAATILDVKIETIFLDTIPDSLIRDLEKKLHVLKEELVNLENQRNLLQSQILFIDSIKGNYAKSISLNNSQKLSVREWEQMLQFVERNKTIHYLRIEENKKRIETVKEKITAVKEEIEIKGNNFKETQKNVKILLQVEHAGKVKLFLKYLISRAGWTPSYEARVTSNSSEMNLLYTAMVHQSTREDWQNIDLILSTARPIEGNDIPLLNPWYIDYSYNNMQVSGKDRRALKKIPVLSMKIPRQGRTLYGKVVDASSGEPLISANIVVQGTNLSISTDINGEYVISNIPPGSYSVRTSYIGYATKNEYVQIFSSKPTSKDLLLEPMAIEGEEVVVTAQLRGISEIKKETVPVEINVARSYVDVQATSSVFRIPSKVSIPSDNEMHKVGITTERFRGVLGYESIPKLNPSVFLRMKAKNNSNYLFLSGPVSVFFDNSFVALSDIQNIFPQDTLSIALGIDDGVRIERKLLNRFTEYIGTFSKSTRIIYDFLVSIKNLRKNDISVLIKDQIPVSRNEKIIVELLEPNPKEKKPDVLGQLEWKIDLNAGEKKEVKLKFSVEYPRDMKVGGFE